MADDFLQDSHDSEFQSEPSASKGVEFAGEIAKKGAEFTADRLDKAKKTGFQYISDDSIQHPTHKRIKTDLNDSEKKRKAHLEKKKREGYLSNSEAKELSVLKQTEKKTKAGAKAEAQRVKTLKAKGNLKEFRLKEYDFKGDTYFKLDKVNTQKAKRRKNRATEHLSRQANAFADDIVKGDEDNWGGEATVKTKQTIKGTYDFLSGTTRNVRDSIELGKRKKAQKEEKKQFKADTEYLYQDFIEKDSKKVAAKKGGETATKGAEKAAKAAQKRKIKRDYAKALTQKSAQGTANAVGTVANATGLEATSVTVATGTGAATGVTGATATTGWGLIIIAIFAILVIFILLLFLIVFLMGVAGTATTIGSTANAVSYHTDRSDIESTEDYISFLELDLEDKINSIEDDYPDYDEYKYNLVEIGHNAFDLSNYMNAKYPKGYTFDDIKAELDTLFGEMYDLILEPKTETRTRYPECHCEHCHDHCGEHCHCEDPEDYEVEVLYVTLTKTSLKDIAADNLDEDQKLLYDAYNDTGGLTQIFLSPLKMDWLNSIGRNYGTSRNPSTKEIEEHKGIDVNAPLGTDVYSGVRKGTVLKVGYSDTFGNYISIQRPTGEVIKYAHLQSVNVSEGDTVDSKTIIGTVGNTGSECNGQSQIHIETLDAEGNYINPTFAINGYSSSFSTSYSSSDTTGKNRVEMGLPTEYASGEVEDLISFAEQFIGTPYVWGGSSPGGFDCSGYVSYCVRESGYYPSMQRTDAQSIYETYCTPVSSSEAQAGDLIFFKGTNSNSPNTITHVGIYCGNGVMLHAGSPINYCNINTSYWTQHLYGYGHIGL